MANSLLDFVMSLVRDPDIAARYTADPDRAIADAGLAGVTSADVDNLIPVVTESMPMGGPGGAMSFGGTDAGIESAGNVWASGAATAAFDAFAAPMPEPVVHDPVFGDDWTAPVIDPTGPAAASADGELMPSLSVDDEVSLQLDEVVNADDPAIDTPVIDDWTGVASDPEPLDDPGAGFDFFN
ncbi:Rv0340 family IniB-related protein [Mycolicibacterium thermoresistibile]